ncbi:5300_t:CDS:2, partial [Acaulospora morrowiae]
CTGCLTNKPIDFTSLPEEFVFSLISDTSQNKFNRRFSATNCFRLCDFCYLDIDPDRVMRNEEHDGGFSINYKSSPSSSPLIYNNDEIDAVEI